MKCKNCGTEANSKFCPSCGSPVEASHFKRLINKISPQKVSTQPMPIPKSKMPFHTKTWFHVLSAFLVVIVCFSVSDAINGARKDSEKFSSASYIEDYEYETKASATATEGITKSPTQPSTQKPTKKATEKSTKSGTAPPTTKAESTVSTTEKPTEKETEKPTEKSTDPPTETTVEENSEIAAAQNGQSQDEHAGGVNGNNSADGYNDSPDTETEVVEEVSKTVYVTPTGLKYHSHKCGKGTYIESTLDYALSIGLEPCKKCY